MSSFRLLLDYDVVLSIEALPKPLRQMVRVRLEAIRDYPASRSDYMERDAIGRPVEINICGPLAIKYWVDHADRQVKVLDIHPADRRG
jgi:hypothetical protein